MYTILILSRPDEFTLSAYFSMYVDTIPDNIKWIGYLELSDTDDRWYDMEICHMLVKDKRIIFDEKTFKEQCSDLGIGNVKKFTVAVIERTYEGISGYFGRIKEKNPCEAYKNLMDLSKRISNCETVPDCCEYYLKHIRRIDRRMSPRSL